MSCARLWSRVQRQHARRDAQVRVGRNAVDVIRLDTQVVRDFVNRERGLPSEQLRKRAVMARIEMLHEHEAHARVRREVLE